MRTELVDIARTDSLQKHGYEKAISRLKSACSAGADVAFFEQTTSIEQTRQAIEEPAPMPCLLNLVEASVTPSLAASESKELGFKTMIVPLVTLAPAYLAIKTQLEKLKTNGTMDGAEKSISPKTLFEVCGLSESMEIDEQAGGKSFANNGK